MKTSALLPGGIKAAVAASKSLHCSNRITWSAASARTAKFIWLLTLACPRTQTWRRPKSSLGRALVRSASQRRRRPRFAFFGTAATPRGRSRGDFFFLRTAHGRARVHEWRCCLCSHDQSSDHSTLHRSMPRAFFARHGNAQIQQRPARRSQLRWGALCTSKNRRSVLGGSRLPGAQ